MFWIARGNRVFLMHSYRDGRGKVLQRRLMTFMAHELTEALEDSSWAQLQAELRMRHPEIRGDWQKLRGRAIELAGAARQPGPRRQTNETDRQALILRAARRLRQLLENEGDSRILKGVRDELRPVLKPGPRPNVSDWMREGERSERAGELRKAERAYREASAAARRELPARRSRFEADEAERYLEALDRRAEILERCGNYGRAIKVLERRLEACSQPEAADRLGMLLQKAGRIDEAIEQYRRRALRDGERHYNEAAALLQAGRNWEAMAPLLRGLARRKDVVQFERVKRRAPNSFSESSWAAAKEYWQRYGSIWTESSREFLLRVSHEPIVRSIYSRMGDRCARVRKVLPEGVMRMVLSQALKNEPLTRRMLV